MGAGARAAIRGAGDAGIDEGARARGDDLARALRALPDVILRCTVEGTITSFEHPERYVPLAAAAERIGQNVLALVTDEETRAEVGRALRACVAERKATSVERAGTLDGVPVFFETWFFPADDGSVIVLVRNATARFGAESRVRSSVRRFEHVFNSSMMAMIEWGADGKVIDANDAFLALVGHSREDLVGGAVSWSAMTPPEYWPLEEQAGLEIARTGTCTPYRKEYVRKDGSRVPVLIGATLHDPQAGLGVAFIVDLSETKRLEDGVRASMARYDLVVRATNDAVWDWDVRLGRVRWNDGFARLFGHRHEDGESTLDWWAGAIHPDDRERVMASINAAVDTGAITWSDEYRFARADGSWAVVHDRGWIYRDEAGQAVHAIGAMVDVTEKKELEQRLLLADRLASLGTLAAGVAHEINNPLTHVILSLEHAARGPGVDDATREALVDARRGAERVRAIVKDLRTFARAELDQKEPVDVRDAVAWAIRIVEPAIRSRGRLAIVIDDVPPVLGDESRLAQVFVNLLVNAAQALPEGEPRRHEVRIVVAHTEDGWIQVEVRDTGQGIPRDALRRIFDPFYTTKGIGEGTGLGLSIAHGIITSIGGTIEVESVVGAGTTFRVRLPPTSRPPRTPRPAAAPPGPRRPGRILIIDDDALTRSLIDRTLRAEHEVVTVASARDALALLARDPRFDVVFSDLMMPEMTGMDFHAALAAVSPELAARVVFLTAGAFTPKAERFLAEVANPCLEKPFDPEALLSFTRERIRGPDQPAPDPARR